MTRVLFKVLSELKSVDGNEGPGRSFEAQITDLPFVMASSTMAASTRAALSGSVVAPSGVAKTMKSTRPNAAATPRCQGQSVPQALAVEGLRNTAQTSSCRNFLGNVDLRKAINVAHVQKAKVPRRGVIVAAAAADDGGAF